MSIMSKPVVEVAVALVYRDDRWLVARRSARRHVGELWEFPGGKCEPHEHAVAAALRELHEECGVCAVAERTLKPVFWEYSECSVHITPVLCRWQAGEIHSSDNETCRWVALEELRQLDMPAANAGIVRRLERHR